MSERTKGQVSQGGTFNPDGPRPTRWLWSETPPGKQSGSIIAKDIAIADADFIEAAWNAADRLGLTAEQLNAGAVEKLVEAATNALLTLNCVADDNCNPESCVVCGLRAALAPYTETT